MFDPRRRVNKHLKTFFFYYEFNVLLLNLISKQTIHKRSQLDEDITAYPRKASRSTGTFHHQNPFVLRTLIDNDRNKPISQRKRSSSNFLNPSQQGHSVRSHSIDTKANNKLNKPKNNCKF